MNQHKKFAEKLQKDIKKLMKHNEEILQQVREHAPEQVDALIRDSKGIMKLVKKGDIDALNKLKQKYADSSNK